MLNILQWNMRGYCNNYSDLQLLINEREPHIICLQETHCLQNFQPHVPKQYFGYFHNFSDIIFPKHGTALLIDKRIPHKIIDLPSTISLVAAEINLKTKFTIVSMYIPPRQDINIQDLQNIVSHLTGKVILVGDMNGWSPLWGSADVNSRGSIIENFILAANLCILNTAYQLT